MKITKKQLIKIIKEETEDVGKMFPSGVPTPASDMDPVEGSCDYWRSALAEINGVVQTVIKNKSLGMKPEIGRRAIEKIAKIISEISEIPEKHRLVDPRKIDPTATWKKS
jgi:hypothetical protein